MFAYPAHIHTLQDKLAYAAAHRKLLRTLEKCTAIEVIDQLPDQSSLVPLGKIVGAYYTVYRTVQPSSIISEHLPEPERDKWLMDCVAPLNIDSECFISIAASWMRIRVVNPKNWLAELWKAAERHSDFCILTLDQKNVVSILSDWHDEKIEAFMEPVETILERESVRSAGSQDFEAVTALLAELGRPTLTEGMEEWEIARIIFERHVSGRYAHSQPLVAERDGVVVGFLSLEFRERLNRTRAQAWIPDLIVTESARGTGAGGALLRRAFEIARRHGCYEVTLESGYARTVAHQVYERVGMKNLGYYFTLPLED